MKNLKRHALAGLLGLLVLSLAAGALAKEPWEKIDIPELNEFQMPDYERVELDNGMVLYLAEDHFLPMLRLSATIRAGSIYEPADKVGLASMTGTVLRTGGAGDRTGDEIDALAEARGLVVETSIGQATGSAYLSCLKEDQALGLELLADILMRPRFAEDKIDLAKEEQKTAISRRNDEPMQIAMREAMKVLFGPDHPLARHPEYDTIAAVGRDDMVAFHDTYFHPDRMYLVVIGDFQRDQMVQAIEDAFAGWAKATQPLPPDPEIQALPRTVNTIDKDDLTQSTIVLGHKGIRNDDPNYAGIVVGNEILGGGFSSRLFKEVRSNRGWAYSVGSRPGTGWRFPGMFMAFTMTKNSTVQQSIDVILDEIQRMVTEPVTEVELQKAKDSILNSEVFNYDTEREVLDRLVLFEMYGYPPDFLDTYQEQVRSLTPAKVLAACQAVWHPDQLSILALGNPAEWDGDLTKFGPVNEIDITIPEPAMDLEIPAATEESLAKGHELMAGLLAKSGGEALTGLKSYHEVSVLTADTPMGPLDINLDKVVVFPDRLHMVTKLPFGEQTQVVTADGGWAKGMSGLQDMSGEQLEDARAQLKMDMLAILRNLDGYRCQALEPTDVDGVACNPVYVTREGEDDDFQLYFLDAATGLVYMQQAQGNNPMTGAPATMRVYVDEHATMDGVQMPSQQRMFYDDEKFADIALKTFEANPEVDAAIFEKPQS